MDTCSGLNGASSSVQIGMILLLVARQMYLRQNLYITPNHDPDVVLRGAIGRVSNPWVPR